MGFVPDFHVVVEWEAVGELVDAVGGVTFDVPLDMSYDDPTQDLHIHISKGFQHLALVDIAQLLQGLADAQVAVLLLVGQGGGQLIGRDVAQLDQQIAQSDVLHGCTPPLSQRITFRETVYTEPSSDVPSGLA